MTAEHPECMASTCPPPKLSSCCWPRCAPVPQWPCEAYGPEGAEFGAICFMSAVPGTRLCKSAEICGLQMAEQRRRVHARIHENARNPPDGMSAADWEYLADAFPTPNMLLNGLRETVRDETGEETCDGCTCCTRAGCRPELCGEDDYGRSSCPCTEGFG